jgi:hypothetical protein
MQSMSRAFRIFLMGSIALGSIPVACRQRAPVQRQTDVRREVEKDTTRVVVPIRDTSIVVFFRDTVPNVVGGRGRAFNLQKAEERQALGTAIRRERELWRSSKPRNYRFLLRVGCFCPGTRGWLLMEVRNGEPLRAWDRTGRPVALTDWNTVSIDGLYDNLAHSADRDGVVQIDFDRRWHYPTYIRTNAARGPDAWSVTDARALQPLR